MNSETILNEQLSIEDKLIYFNNSILNFNFFKKDLDIFIENLINNYYSFKNYKLVLDQILLLKKLFSIYTNDLNIIFNILLNYNNIDQEENKIYKNLYDSNFKITELIGNIPINIKEKISPKIYNVLSLLNDNINYITIKEIDASDTDLEEQLIEEEDMPISDGLFSFKAFITIFVIVFGVFFILSISLGLLDHFNK